LSAGLPAIPAGHVSRSRPSLPRLVAARASMLPTPNARELGGSNTDPA